MYGQGTIHYEKYRICTYSQWYTKNYLVHGSRNHVDSRRRLWEGAETGHAVTDDGEASQNSWAESSDERSHGMSLGSGTKQRWTAGKRSYAGKAQGAVTRQRRRLQVTGKAHSSDEKTRGGCLQELLVAGGASRRQGDVGRLEEACRAKQTRPGDEQRWRWSRGEVEQSQRLWEEQHRKRELEWRLGDRGVTHTGADNGSVVGGAGRRRQHNEAATDVVVEFVDRCHHIYVLVWCT